MLRILVVEDAPEAAFGLQLNFELEGWHVVVSNNGTEALAQAKSTSFHLVILDLSLSDMPGLVVLGQLNALYGLPVIVITGSSDELTRVSAFRLGAVDCVTKPFSLLELIARVRLRARDEGNRPRLVINPVKRLVLWNDHPVPMTAKEFDLLSEIAQARGAVVSREQLLAKVWRAPPDLATRTVDAHLQNLRRKLSAAGVPQNVINTVRGKGFAWSGSIDALTL